MAEELSPSRILVVDDHPLLRQGFIAILSRQADMEVVGEAGDGLEALKLCQKWCPDVVLMDLSMPKMDGIDATRALKECCPQTVVLVLTAYESEALMLKAIRAGAAGYVLKGIHPDELLKSVREVLEGESPMDQRLAARLLRRLANEEAGTTTVDQLTSVAATQKEEEARGQGIPSLSPRELEVLEHLVAGRSNRQIAQALHFSLSTVKRHLERINSKLGTSDRTQAVVKAIELGLLAGRKER